jgi:hypothetical protein
VVKGLSLWLCCNGNYRQKVEFQCPNLDKGTQGVVLEAVQYLSNTILLLVKDLMSKLVLSVNALRAERTNRG